MHFWLHQVIVVVLVILYYTLVQMALLSMLIMPFMPFAPYSFLPEQLQATSSEAQTLTGIALYKISQAEYGEWYIAAYHYLLIVLLVVQLLEHGYFIIFKLRGGERRIELEILLFSNTSSSSILTRTYTALRVLYWLCTYLSFMVLIFYLFLVVQWIILSAMVRVNVIYFFSLSLFKCNVI